MFWLQKIRLFFLLLVWISDYLKYRWKLYLCCRLLKLKVASVLYTFPCLVWCYAHRCSVAVEWICLLEAKVFLFVSTLLCTPSPSSPVPVGDYHTTQGSPCHLDTLSRLCEARSEPSASGPTYSIWHVTLFESLPPLIRQKGPFPSMGSEKLLE